MRVTQEYLLSHGFIQYHSPIADGASDLPYFDENWLHFREVESHRQMFVLCFEIGEESSPLTYVQEDYGCGFVLIPFPWSELTVDFFESVYWGIRGERPIHAGCIGNDKKDTGIQ